MSFHFRAGNGKTEAVEMSMSDMSSAHEGIYSRLPRHSMRDAGYRSIRVIPHLPAGIASLGLPWNFRSKAQQNANAYQRRAT